MNRVLATVFALTFAALVPSLTGCAVRWREGGRERMAGFVVTEQRGPHYQKRTSFGLTMDLVDPGVTLGVTSLEDRTAELTSSDPVELWQSAGATTAETAAGGAEATSKPARAPPPPKPVRRQWFLATMPLPTGPRLRYQRTVGAVAGDLASGRHLGVGAYAGSEFVDIGSNDSLLFVAPQGWHRPADARGWIWSNDE